MKKVFIYLGIALGFASCVNPINELKDPNADFEFVVRRNGEDLVNPDYVEAGEAVVFRTTGSSEGDKFAIYPGDGDGKFAYNEDPEKNGRGYPMGETRDNYQYTYSYAERGTFKAVHIATSYNKFIEDVDENIKQTNSEKEVHVVDFHASFEFFSLKSFFGDKYFSVPDNDNVDGNYSLEFPNKNPGTIQVQFDAGNATVKCKTSLISAYPWADGTKVEPVDDGTGYAVLSSQNHMINFKGSGPVVLIVEAADPDPITKEKLKKEYVVTFTK